jgi:hypothetical protein
VNHARRDLCGGGRSNAHPYRDRLLRRVMIGKGTLVIF